MKFKNFIGHFNTVNKHRWLVFKFAIKAGIPFRGLVHDLSKYSLEEFFRGVKYYQGTYSPITAEKRDIGYSTAWLHHKGRNKHHWEYWYDEFADIKAPVVPYKYAVEMACDSLSASKVYNGKNWTPKSQIEYWNRTASKRKLNPKIEAFLTEVFETCGEDGIDKTFKSKKLRKMYDKYVNNEEE